MTYDSSDDLSSSSSRLLHLWKICGDGALLRHLYLSARLILSLEANPTMRWCKKREMSVMQYLRVEGKRNTAEKKKKKKLVRQSRGSADVFVSTPMDREMKNRCEVRLDSGEGQVGRVKRTIGIVSIRRAIKHRLRTRWSSGRWLERVKLRQ